MKRGHHYIYLFVVLNFIYCAWLIFNPADSEVLSRHNLSITQARLLILTIAAPIIAIWSFIFYGFYKTNRYVNSIGDSPESPGLRNLGLGLMILAFGMPLSSILSRVYEHIGEAYPDWSTPMTIASNYTSLLLVLVVFILIGNGAEKLAALVRKRPTLREQNFWTVTFMILSGIYSYFVVASNETTDGYKMPSWLVLFTIALPYLYVWYRGLLAAYHINYYRSQVRGRIYKHALGYFSAGIGSFIGASIILQLITSAAPRLEQLNLTSLLVVIYALLVLLAFGFVLIAAGAKKLQKIEEV